MNRSLEEGDSNPNGCLGGVQDFVEEVTENLEDRKKTRIISGI